MLTLSRRQLQSVSVLCSEREHLREQQQQQPSINFDTKNIFNVKICDLRAQTSFSQFIVHFTLEFGPSLP